MNEVSISRKQVSASRYVYLVRECNRHGHIRNQWICRTKTEAIRICLGIAEAIKHVTDARKGRK